MALGGVFGTVTTEPMKQHDVETFMQVSRGTIRSTISAALAESRGLKVQLVLQMKMVKINPETDQHVCINPHFRLALTTVTESA